MYNKNVMKYLSINICGKTLSWSVIDENLIVEKIHKKKMNDLNANVENFTKAIKGIVVEAEEEYGKINDVALALPGAVDSETSILVQRARWLDKLETKSYLKDLFSDMQQNFHFVNDATSSLIGSSAIGKANKYENVVYFICGTGTGASIKINGKIFQGTNHISGEIGKTQSQGTTVESLLSLPTIIAQASIISGKEIRDHKELNLVLENDSSLKDFMNEWFETFVKTLQNIILYYDPQLIIIQSELYSMPYFSDKDIYEELRIKLGDFVNDNIKIAEVEVGHDSTQLSLVGAVYSLMENKKNKE